MTNKNYGCYNRNPFAKTVTVQDGWRKVDGVRHMVRIENQMKKDCQYTHTELGKTDQGCAGCAWRKA